jgi:hypothetical protein
MTLEGHVQLYSSSAVQLQGTEYDLHKLKTELQGGGPCAVVQLPCGTTTMHGI